MNAEGTRVVLEEALRAGVQRVVHTSSVAAIGPAPPHSALDERAPYPGHLGLPYPDSKRAAEIEALRVGAHGLPVVIVNPAHVFGPGDWGPSSTDVVRRFLLRRIPAYVERGDQHRRRPRRRLRAPARRRARGARGALHPRQPQLHLGAPVRRARARVGRGRARRPGPLRRWRWRWPESGSACPGARRWRRPRSGPPRSGGRIATTAPGASSAGACARTRRRSRRPCDGGWSASATASPGRASRSRCGWRARRAGRSGGVRGWLTP